MGLFSSSTAMTIRRLDNEKSALFSKMVFPVWAMSTLGSNDCVASSTTSAASRFYPVHYQNLPFFEISLPVNLVFFRKLALTMR
ncbi:hypothetical protein M7I_1581 [Glarea lozoyensis 74030]|uniref:Uncharacterized protein n=1 Tax=Glarea lozoyensis (strain ATCC 74030 / MF5533) TaxID=1104152 RepID=H0EGG5_GLAL7|nr:hypothetical protein M7I_1581 [Glarea lozoyensis 74030]